MNQQDDKSVLEYLRNVVVKGLCDMKEEAVYFLKPVNDSFYNYGAPFLENYYKVIKSPMDLKTVTERLDSSFYSTSKQCIKDINLIFSNCFLYNFPDEPAHVQGKFVQKVYKNLMAKCNFSTSVKRKHTDEICPEPKKPRLDDRNSVLPAKSKESNLFANSLEVQRILKLNKTLSDSKLLKKASKLDKRVDENGRSLSERKQESGKNSSEREVNEKASSSDQKRSKSGKIKLEKRPDQIDKTSEKRGENGKTSPSDKRQDQNGKSDKKQDGNGRSSLEGKQVNGKIHTDLKHPDNGKTSTKSSSDKKIENVKTSPPSESKRLENEKASSSDKKPDQNGKSSSDKIQSGKASSGKKSDQSGKSSSSDKKHDQNRKHSSEKQQEHGKISPSERKQQENEKASSDKKQPENGKYVTEKLLENESTSSLTKQEEAVKASEKRQQNSDSKTSPLDTKLFSRKMSSSSSDSSKEDCLRVAGKIKVASPPVKKEHGILVDSNKMDTSSASKQHHGDICSEKLISETVSMCDISQQPFVRMLDKTSPSETKPQLPAERHWEQHSPSETKPQVVAEKHWEQHSPSETKPQIAAEKHWEQHSPPGTKPQLPAERHWEQNSSFETKQRDCGRNSEMSVFDVTQAILATDFRRLDAEIKPEEPSSYFNQQLYQTETIARPAWQPYAPLQHPESWQNPIMSQNPRMSSFTHDGNAFSAFGSRNKPKEISNKERRRLRREKRLEMELHLNREVMRLQDFTATLMKITKESLVIEKEIKERNLLSVKARDLSVEQVEQLAGIYVHYEGIEINDELTINFMTAQPDTVDKMKQYFACVNKYSDEQA